MLIEELAWIVKAEGGMSGGQANEVSQLVETSVGRCYVRGFASSRWQDYSELFPPYVGGSADGAGGVGRGARGEGRGNNKPKRLRDFDVAYLRKRYF
jgi:hypothetical protein